MKPNELGSFAIRARALFGAPIDEKIFVLALREIALHSPARSAQALDAYAARYGGPRMTFFPGKYLEFYAATRAAESDGVAARAVESTDAAAERLRVECDWRAIRARVARLTPDALAAALQDASARLGRAIPAGATEGADLPRSWLVAVSDAAGRPIREY